MRSNASSSNTRILAAIGSFVMVVFFVTLNAGPAPAADVKISIDQATLLELDKPASEVIVGNPSIADVTVQSGQLLVVTGKSSGLTNIIVLDGSGSPIYNEKIFVSADTKRLVTVNKGINRETYSCSPACGPSLIPGDTVALFDPLSKAIRNKLGLAQSAAEGTTAQQ